MASTLPTLNYTTPEEFVNYYYEQLKTDLAVYDLQINKVGFVGYFLNLLGYTHFDLKQYYDSLFKESFVGTTQTEESQYLHASSYGYIPTFATPSTVTGTIEFDMINWLPRRASGTVRREVIVGYNVSSGRFVPSSASFKIQDILFSIDSVYKFVEIEENGSYYYYADITTADGTKITLPSSASLISAPLYSTSQYVKKEISFELKPYNYGSYQTYYFGIDAGYFLSDLEVYVTELGSSAEEQYDVSYTKYLAKGNDKSVFLRKVTSTNYVIEFGSGLRGKWISGASIRLLIKSTRGTAGNLIDKTNSKVQIIGNVFAFDYEYATGGSLTSTGSNPVVMQQPLIDFDYSEAGLDSLSGEDLRDAIVKFIQTRDNLVSQQDFYNIAASYLEDFKFLFKKFNVFENSFHLCRSFRDRNQSIFYTTNYTNQIISLEKITSGTVSATAPGSLPSGNYEYTIVAIDDWGKSAPSEILSISVDNGAGENSATIAWDSVPYATKYRIYGRDIGLHDQYWEVTDNGSPTFSYVDDNTTGTLLTEPPSYQLQDILYRPTFTINSRSFISPFIYKGNTRMNYYEGYLIKDLARVEFASIVQDPSIIGTGFDIPMTYLNLDYDDSTAITTIKLKSYQTISNLVFSISIFGDNLELNDKRMECFPLSNNYFEYSYNNTDTFGIFEGEIQIEVKGGTSDAIITDKAETYAITGANKVLKIKFNDSSTGYTDSFTTVTFSEGTITATQIASEINTAVSDTLASVFVDDDGNNRVKIIAPSGATVYNIFIASTGSTCLTILGLTGNDTEPAVLNGLMTTATTYFTCTTNKFYQLVDVSDQLQLMRYNVLSDSYVINIPVVDETIFNTDPDYYLDKIKNFIVDSSFKENRMITDNVQCRFLNTYLIESPFIESIFVQSGQIFSNKNYVFLNPVVEIRDFPPTGAINGQRFLVSTTPTGGSYYEGHVNEIAIYNTTISSPYWEFYSPLTNDFVLDTDTNIYYTWSGANWINIPNIELPLKIQVEAKADKNYIQKNNIDIASERESLMLAIAEYLQKGFSGAAVIFYNSLIVEFTHSGRPFIKSVKVYVTDSSTVPNEMDNGLEVNNDTTVLKSLKNKLDIVRFTPPMIYWDVDNIIVTINVE